MCGRFTNRYSWSELVALYRITEPWIGSIPNDPPRFNIAPTQTSWVVRTSKNGGRELARARWGLVPSWAKDTSAAARCINARAETVATRPSFRNAFRQRPCLAIADGFYEWEKLASGHKQPWFFTTHESEPFAFAGLWEWWRAPDAPKSHPGLESFTILTTTPNALCAPVHDRMPLMLAMRDWQDWLDTEEKRRALLKPFLPERMRAWRVSSAVSAVRNDGPELISPLAA